MFSAALRVLQIKDLKDLSFLSVGVTIDMQVLKDLKRHPLQKECSLRER